MDTRKITENVYWVGAKDRDIEIFDVILKVEHGTTYNSYFINGGDKKVLIDTVKGRFTDEYLEKVRSFVPIEEISSLVVNHTEPDHSGAILRLLDINPGIEIIGTKQSEIFLKDILNRDFKMTVVKGGEKITLGGGMTLSFIKVPFVHWPDTMFTWLEEKRALFSCDCFGAHYCFGDDMFDIDNAEMRGAREYYFNYILRPYRQKVREALEAADGLKPSLLLPSHGPMYQTPSLVFDSYREWVNESAKTAKTRIIIIYVTAHGNTGIAADEMAKVFESEGADVAVYDYQKVDPEKLRCEIETADGVLFGSPTLVNDAPGPIWDALYLLSTVKHRVRLVSAFGSYGWSGEAVERLLERMKGMRLKVYEPGFRFKFVPDEVKIGQMAEFSSAFIGMLEGR